MIRAFVNGEFLTLDPLRPRAQALLVENDHLTFVGDVATARQGNASETIDLGGKTVVPGFIDSHLHCLSYGTGLLRQADLVGAGTIDEMLDRLRAHADACDGEWLQGRGFDQDKMPGRRFPTRADLDRVSVTRPILLTRVCGHAAVANSAAIGHLTPQERAAGDPESGLYTETAIRAFYRRVPPLTESEQEEAVLCTARVALSTGITSIGTLLDTPQEMGAYARLRRRGRLPLRVTGMPPASSVEPLHAHGIGTTFGDDWLRLGGAKFFADGSLGARTALLSAPYADEDRPENLGIRIYPPDDLKARAKAAQERGFQIVIHAIGDQAVREAVEAIECALGDGDNALHRHRIEHVSLLPPDLRERMAQRRIVAVVQPQFVTSDTWTAERVGQERAPWAYPFRAMRDAGIPLALSSDAPVEKLDAFACLAAAVGRAPWSPTGGLSVDEALHDYCLGSAHALHIEDRVGSLSVGKLADFVVLSDNPLRCAADSLRRLRAERVFVGGLEWRGRGG